MAQYSRPTTLAAIRSHNKCWGRPVARKVARSATRLGRLTVLSGMLCVIPAQGQAACAIANSAKFGVGTKKSATTNLNADLNNIGAAWYYDWGFATSGTNTPYVSMIWSSQYMNYAASAPGKILLGFNEPDNQDQANMSPTQALSYWPNLMSTGKRLGSPAVQTGNELGTKWLGQFMTNAALKNYRVDFIAVHYYTTNRSVSSFKYYLQKIYNVYRKPIWVTEWALADWNNPNRFAAKDQATFLTQGVEMMDNLPFVERHAWFGMYNGMDGWSINSGLVNGGSRTTVGNAYLAEVSC